MEKSDFPPKKLITQLGFTESSEFPSTVGLPLPEQSISRPTTKSKSYPPLDLPPRLPLAALMLDSPITQSHIYTQDRVVTPKEQKQCKCKRSQCLQLYCECFSKGTYCDGCGCTNCKNNIENDAARNSAVGSILERKPCAFSPKIASSPCTMAEAKDDVMMGKHNRGCLCKKSGCLKGYCECFQARIICSEYCKCVDCKNIGRKESYALYDRRNGNTEDLIQQTNAAITGAIGFSGYRPSHKPRKRKVKETFLGSKREDSPVSKHAQNQQVNHIGRFAAFSSSKFTYRSLLAGIIQAQDVSDLCSILVRESEDAKALAVKNGSVKEQTGRENQTPSSRAAKDEGKCQEAPDFQKAISNEPFCGNKVNITRKGNPESSDADIQKGRPMSLQTLALMCDEKDALLIPEVSLGQILSHGCSEDVYFEQERLLLVRFHDFLSGLITRGNAKATECFLFDRLKTEVNGKLEQ